MAALLWPFVASAQKSAIQMEEERAKRCPEGQYSGPHEGARRYYKDPYAWFVSREFAKRFCMPDSYIDDSLKGALALAVRIKPEDFTLCGFIGGPSQCPVKSRLLLDVYIDNRKVIIPKADPAVVYYSGNVANSGSNEIAGVGLPRSDRRRKGEVTEVEGERRPFSPIGKDRVEHWLRFEYLGVRNGIADVEGDFIESFYRANWVDGIDLITLDGVGFGYSSLVDPRRPVRSGDEVAYPQIALDRTNPIQEWAIGVIWGRDLLRVAKRSRMGGQYAIPYPESFLHTIHLPMRVVEQIFAFDYHQGDLLMGAARDSVLPKSAGNR